MQRENYLSSIAALRWEEQFPKPHASATEVLQTLLREQGIKPAQINFSQEGHANVTEPLAHMLASGPLPKQGRSVVPLPHRS